LTDECIKSGGAGTQQVIFRIVDGADEVHKRSIARAAFEDVPEDELENLPRF